MARKTCFLLISVILINCVFCGSAAAPDNNNLNSYDLELQWDKDAQPPFVRIFFNTGKPPELMLPLRYLVESSGGVVEWNSSLKTAVINKKALVVTGDFYDVIGTGTGTSALLGQVKEPDHDILRGIMKNGTLFVSARELNNQIKVAEISLDYEVPDNHFSYAYWPPVEDLFHHPLDCACLPLEEAPSSREAGGRFSCFLCFKSKQGESTAKNLLHPMSLVVKYSLFLNGNIPCTGREGRKKNSRDIQDKLSRNKCKLALCPAPGEP